MDFKGLIFDFDGTLAELNINFKIIGQQVKQTAAQMGYISPWPDGYLLEAVHQVSVSLGNGFKKKALEIIQTAEIKAAEKGALFPFTLDILAKARDKRLGLAIVSRNCEAAIKTVFPAIEDHCDSFIPRDLASRIKPHPGHIEQAAQELEVRVSETLVIGDHPMDIKSAKAAGAVSVGVASGRVSLLELEKSGADYVLTDAGELLYLLEKLEVQKTE
jgi:phosphoglycolate phosphatase